MAMLEYVARKALYVVVVLLMIIAFEFVLFQILPNGLQDPKSEYFNCPACLYAPVQPPRGVSATEWTNVIRTQIAHGYGFGEPLWIRFLDYYRLMLTSNFGYNTGNVLGGPVLATISRSLPLTALLVGSSVFSTLAVGAILGVVSPARRGNLRRSPLGVIVLLSLIPSFVIGVFVQVAYLRLTGMWYQPLGTALIGTSGWSSYLVTLKALLLPSFTLTLTGLGSLLLIGRKEVVDSRKADFTEVASSNGLTKSTVLYPQSLKNSILPSATMFGVVVCAIISWDVVPEVIFAWPGLGYMMFLGLATGDLPLEQALFFTMSVMVLIAFFAAEIVRGVLDPRARSGDMKWDGFGMPLVRPLGHPSDTVED